MQRDAAQRQGRQAMMGNSYTILNQLPILFLGTLYAQKANTLPINLMLIFTQLKNPTWG